MVAGRKVLVLQSNPAEGFALAAGLRQSGWAILSAQDAAQAMTVARRQNPDAVVLHSGLAGGGGTVALRRLRSSVYTTLIPVICIVPKSSLERDALANIGVQDMIEPPGDPVEIHAALERHLGRSSTNVEVSPEVLGSPHRRAALESSGLLDTPVDEAFDRLLQLTTQLIGVPVALVSVVDTNRQFFKSQVGLPEPWSTKRETPLSHSFCQWVVGGQEEVVVNDAREDPVLRTNLAIRDLGVTAYAGVPFGSDSGETLGSFCAIDSKPRAWRADELSMLRDLSSVLQAYVAVGTKGASSQYRVGAISRGMIGALHVLNRIGDRGAQVREIACVIEQLGHLLVRVTHEHREAS